MVMLLVGGLSGLAAFAAGVTDDLPMVVQIVVVLCLALSFGLLLGGMGTERAKSSRSD